MGGWILNKAPFSEVHFSDSNPQELNWLGSLLLQGSDGGPPSSVVQIYRLGNG